ncbi:ABC transporter permease [Herbaspirillum sp. meg3]|uniref:DUF4198 domain-containing protein n=1 Tax=Herbaspirillum sp. meg3 TaxID=2025949 RepID=UPI000B99A9CD|nr:DUF4198 domain-containing protein [Herbaspirillum sp. meg3]ASU39318.1 ABC transporter permease [Herbaspirillum sp. meg3]
MKRAFKIAALAMTLAIGLPLSANAHRTWLLPASTVLSGNDPWVTVDAAVSNDLFFFESFALKLDGLQVTAPDGTFAKPENAYTGKFRTSFDVHLTQSGTYKIAVISMGLFGSYKDAAGQTKRWRGTAEAMAKEIPADAKDLQVTQMQGRIETFVTAGKPSKKVLETTGSGLELQAITHPTDLIAGETASFRMLLDGKPAANVKVTVVPGGTRYRDKLNEMTPTTDTDGKFSVTWPSAGMYWMEATVKDNKPNLKPATDRRANYTATLEVLAP